MQVKLITKNKEKTNYTFLVKDVTPAVLNSLRRSIVSLVPTMAIENVEFRKNSSILYDEVLAHRLGLIPLKTDLKSYDMVKSPEDEESLKCTVKFTLKLKGPKTVYSKDLSSADPAIVPVYDTIPLVKLLKNQEIALEAVAMLGTGKDHMKWSPGIVFYKHKPIVTVKGNFDVERLRENIPEDSAITINGSKVSVDDEKLYTTNYFDAFVGESFVPGVEVSSSENEFIFNIESFGQLTPKQMVDEGIKAIAERLEAIDKELSGKNKK